MFAPAFRIVHPSHCRRIAVSLLLGLLLPFSTPSTASGRQGQAASVPARSLLETADLALVGVVESIESDWDEAHRAIRTRVRIRVDRGFGSAEDIREVVLDQAGGTVGDTTMRISHLRQPSFQQGDRLALLLRRDRRQLWTRGLVLGKEEVRDLVLVAGRLDPVGDGRLHASFPGLRNAFESTREELWALFGLESGGATAFDAYVDLLAGFPKEEKP